MRDASMMARALVMAGSADAGTARLAHDLAGEGRVVRGADEGHRDHVHAGGERPAQVGLVLAGERGGADRDAAVERLGWW